MDPGRRDRLLEIFARAAELAGEARESYLAEACDGDGDLRAEVESLLENDTAATDQLQAGIDRALEEFAASTGDPSMDASAHLDSESLSGTMVGPYRLTDSIGRGGMGSVWRAVRDDDAYTRVVAVKLMHRGLHDSDLRARFAAERRILASLDHPCIARLIDGGTTGAGVPYVVMEHVEGRPIHRYSDEERLDIDRRLGLFRQVCSAISYAHRNLVVHRDLKPGNILVTSEGVPKLLDFGIAKLLDPSESAHAPETRTGMRLMTPEYASPEQIRGRPVTTASDVYAAGVLLYELLTGRRPYALRNRGPVELERVICEQEPDRPSTAVTRETGEFTTTGEPTTAERIGLARRALPAQLRQRLHGDLDNIVLKALRKEPDQRYASIDLLSEDIRRHLAGLPVLARPATWRYRTGKFLSRHRLGAAATAAVTVLMIGLVGFYTLRLRAERSRAEAEARGSARVSDFLVDLFKGADPYEYRGEPISAKEILDRGADRIRTQLAGDPAIQLRMLETMARAYSNLSEFEPAVTLIDSAVDLQRQSGDASPGRQAELLGLQGDLLTSLARYEESREVLEQALRASEEAHGRIHDRTIQLNNAIGIVDELEGNWKEAEKRYLGSLDLSARLPDAPDSPAAANTHNLLARLYTRKGLQNKSIEHGQECVRIRDHLYSESDPRRIGCIALLGTAYSVKGDVQAAEPVLLEALRLSRTLLGDQSLSTANALSNLSGLYKRHGEPERALPLLEENLAIKRRTLPPDHPELAIALNNLANVLQDLGWVEESLEPQREALAINRKAYGDEHPEVASNLNNLAAKLRDLGHYEEAEEMYRKTLAIDLETLKERHPFLAMDWCNLAALYNDMKRYNDAEPLLRRALELQDGNPEVNPVNLASTLVTLGILMTRTGRPAEAEPVLRRAVDIRASAMAADSLDLAVARHLLGRALLARGEAEQARRIMEPSFEIIRARPIRDRARREATERMIQLYEAVGDRSAVARLRAELTRTP